MGEEAPLIMECRSTSDHERYVQSDASDNHCSQSEDSLSSQTHLSVAQLSLEGESELPTVVLSTRSPAALKLGTQQLIPKSLAVASRPKNRHHTTVVTFPLGLETVSPSTPSRHSVLGSEVSWDDYDSDGDEFSLRRNRRNKSYKAAVTRIDLDAMTQGPGSAATLQPIKDSRIPSPRTVRAPGRKRTLGRKRNQKHGGSFKDEPRLYQEIKERGLHSTNQNAEEEIVDDFVIVEPPSDQGIVVNTYRPAQVTWSQLPQIKDTGILQRISAEERKRQEAIFEIITSEYSYLHSLSILVRNFKDSDALRRTLTPTEHHHLFSNIAVIHNVSKGFFEDLERRHHANPVIQDISDIVQNHATHRFEPYIMYCSNETFQQRTLQKLLASNTAFKEVLKQIEGNKECGGLPMISFLILPMQRVTRLPLLLDTICQKTQDKTAEYFAAVWALNAISKLVSSCNDGARKMERTEQMYTIQKQMDFGKIKPFPLVSSSRWLQKRGELAVCTEELSIFWKTFSHKSYYLFLFNDVLIVTKKKSEESYVVMDYATLVNVEVKEEAEERMSPSSKGASSLGLSLRLQITRNSEGRPEHIALVAESRVDRARWVSALQELKQTGNSINKDGLPQFEATKSYMPKQPDELGLQQAEVVIVLQREEDWCHGERMRDGVRGWFPAACATEITNRAAMENNVQRMKRLRKETNV